MAVSKYDGPILFYAENTNFAAYAIIPEVLDGYIRKIGDWTYNQDWNNERMKAWKNKKSCRRDGKTQWKVTFGTPNSFAVSEKRTTDKFNDRERQMSGFGLPTRDKDRNSQPVP